MTDRRNWYAVIVGGGTGNRFGSSIPKQFVTVMDQPVISWTVRSFLAVPGLTGLVIVCHRDWTGFCRDSMESLTTKFPGTAITVIEGGAERQESARIGVDNIQCLPNSPVLIHDAARPLIIPDLIGRILNATRTAGAAIPVIPHSDSIVAVENGMVMEYPDRETSGRVQTPQGFQYRIIREAHDLAVKSRVSRAVDDGSLVLNAGYPVAVVDGDTRNIKITREEDLDIIAKLWPE